MTSLSDVKSSAINLLSQLLQGGGLAAAAGGETPSDTPCTGFVEALGRRLRELLVQSGADPAEVAALDGQALLAQCMSLLQVQIPVTPAHQSLPDATPVSEATAKGVPETPGELLDWLRLSAGVETAGEVVAPALVEPAPDEGASLVFARQLLRAIRTEGVGIDPGTPDGQPREPVRHLSPIPSGLADSDASDGVVQLRQGAVTASPMPLAWGATGDTAEAPAPPPTAAESAWSELGLLSPDGRATDLVSDPDQELTGMPGQAGADADGDASAQPATTLGLIGSLAADRQGPAVRALALDLSKLLQPGGDARLAEQVTWVLQSGGGSAELELHPAHLGSLGVRIRIEDDQAHVHFVSPHPIVREVIEAALPRLRESLAQEGVTLANVSVSDQAPGGRGEQEQRRAGGVWSDPDAASGMSAETEEPPTVRSTLSALAGRHDYFA